MTDNSEYPWLRNYPKEIPAEINPDIYSSIPDFIKKIADEYGATPAYSNFDVKMSYQELEDRTTVFASYLQSLSGLKKGDRVAIMMPNLLQYLVAVFGAIKAGMIVVNINPLYTPRELDGILKDSQAKALVIIDTFAKTFERIAEGSSVEYVIVTSVGDLFPPAKRMLFNFVTKKIKKLVPKFNLPNATTFREAMAIGSSRKFEPVEIKNTDTAFLQYTGGTTGVSKGAMITHRNIIANQQQTSVWLSTGFVKRKEVVMLALPLYHAFSFTGMCAFLQWGSKLVLITNPRDIKGLVKEWDKNHFSVMMGVNTLFNALLNAPGFDKLDFSALKLCVGGGTQVQKPVAERWHKLTGAYIIEAYGLTEASPGVTANTLNSAWNGSVGFPFSSTIVSIRGEGFKDLGYWTTINEVEEHTGEICVKGPQVMAGYWNSPDKTALAIRDGWLRTGDIGHMDSNGRITITDRQKDLILVSGFNVYPNEVETVLQSMPEILECGVVGMPSEKTGEMVKAVIVKKDPNLTKEQVIAFCRQNLTGYKIPREVIFVDSIPKTLVGKILRRELKSIVEKNQ